MPGRNGWVEIRNLLDEHVDLTGWMIDDGEGGSAPRTIYTTVDGGDFGLVQFGGINTASADSIRLIDRTGAVYDEISNGWAGSTMGEFCYDREKRRIECTPGSENVYPTRPARCALPGGTYEGVVFAGDEECRTLAYLNRARFSQLAPLTSVARLVAYDGRPWTSVQAFSDLVSANALRLAKEAADHFSDDGLSTDTVANTWAHRAELTDVAVLFDRVYAVRRAPGTDGYYCVELRDAPDAANDLTACVLYVNADSAPACSDEVARTCSPAGGGVCAVLSEGTVATAAATRSTSCTKTPSRPPTRNDFLNECGF
jgi:hypothetical protein